MLSPSFLISEYEASALFFYLRFLIREAALGLAELHARGLAMQDVSLENLLVFVTDRGLRVKCCDPGQAVIIETQSADVKVDLRDSTNGNNVDSAHAKGDYGHNTTGDSEGSNVNGSKRDVSFEMMDRKMNTIASTAFRSNLSSPFFIHFITK